MVIVEYEWYKATYGGELDEATFTRLSSQAFLVADALTEYRLGARWPALPAAVQNGVRSAICAYTEQAHIEEQGGPVASETNDGISRSYAVSGSSRNADTAQGRLSNALRLYLAPTGLLYRGRSRR